ncbi:MAG: hypothetical protein ACE5H3_12520 [Planctomycetota bacterium]
MKKIELIEQAPQGGFGRIHQVPVQGGQIDFLSRTEQAGQETGPFEIGARPGESPAGFSRRTGVESSQQKKPEGPQGISPSRPADGTFQHLESGGASPQGGGQKQGSLAAVIAPLPFPGHPGLDPRG